MKLRRTRRGTSGPPAPATPADPGHNAWATALARAGQPNLVAVPGVGGDDRPPASSVPDHPPTHRLAAPPVGIADQVPVMPAGADAAWTPTSPATTALPVAPTPASSAPESESPALRGRRRRGQRSTVPAPDPNDLSGIDVERALRLVRMAAAMIAMAAALGARAGTAGGLNGPGAAAAILAGAVIINLFTIWAGRRGWGTGGALVAQALDVAASLGLVLLLDRALEGSAWMVLLLPIVMGGVRFGAAGTLLAWTLACAGYFTLVLTGVLTVEGDKADEFAASLQRFAFLLALAVPVAALTQWLQQRWEHQRGLTVAASLRAQRLELIENMARSFIGANEPRLMANLADAGVQLGFPTVSLTMHTEHRSMTVAAMGVSRRLPTDDVAIRPAPGETLVTHWEPVDDRDDPLTSVSIMLDASGNAIAFHGWSTDDVDDDMAQAFGLLGAHASVALRASRVLADLERQAKQDPLTGLLNRRAFDDLLNRRSAAGSSVALLLLDVDHFKTINDTHGHPAGDRVLRIIAERLRSATRATGRALDASVARVGGDEFALLIAETTLDIVAEVADHIEKAMEEPIAIGNAAVAVSFSIGIADAGGTWVTRDLVAAADGATYQAKTHGRNRTCWATGPVGSPTHASPSGALPPAPMVPDPADRVDDEDQSGDHLMNLLRQSIEDANAQPWAPPQPRPVQ